MKRRSLKMLVVALFIGSLGMQQAHAKVIAPAPAPKAFVYNKQALAIFNQLANVKGWLKPLKPSQSKALSNSTLTNHRCCSRTMNLPALAVYNGAPDPVIYYIDGICPAGATINFDIPDITGIGYLEFATRGDALDNTEYGTISTNGGTVTARSQVDIDGLFVDFFIPAITNGVKIDIY